MTLRNGRFRIVGPAGRCVVHYRLTETTVIVLAKTSPAGGRLVFALRPRPRAWIRCIARSPDGWPLALERDSWDLQPHGHGFGSIGGAFDSVMEEIGLGADFPPSRGQTRARNHARRLLTALGREAVLRCDPQARALASCFSNAYRFWVYRQIIGDPTGRIGQMSSVCPGLLLIAHGLSAEPLRPGTRSKAILAGVVEGRPLPVLLSEAAALSLAPDVLAVWSGSAASFRLSYVGAEDIARALAAKRLLIRRARPLVAMRSIFEAPPSGFAPEDIPRDPVSNARWYATMRLAQHILSRVCEPDLQRRLSSFVSAHAGLIASRAYRRQYPRDELTEVDEPGLAWQLERLVRFARASERVPDRRGNPRRYLSQRDRWFRPIDGDTPAARLGALLRRLPALGLGQVVSVRALREGEDFARLERITIPSLPTAASPIPGLRLRAIDTPEALAEEGDRMNHCVASWLPHLLAGKTWVYSALASGVAITVAVGRDAHGVLRIEEARRQDNRRPTQSQLHLLELWIEQMDAVTEVASRFP